MQARRSPLSSRSSNPAAGLEPTRASISPILCPVWQANPSNLSIAERPQNGPPLYPNDRYRSTWFTQTDTVEDVGDLCINVVVEELVDELDDHGRRLYLLRGGLWIQRRQRFGLAAIESHVDARDAFRGQFNQRGILDDVGEQSFALAVRGGWIIPELLESVVITSRR